MPKLMGSFLRCDGADRSHRLDIAFDGHTVSQPSRSTTESRPWAMLGGGDASAQIRAELSNVRERLATDAQLVAEAGLTPLTHNTGKRRCVTFHSARNHRLRHAITCLAENSRHSSQWAAQLQANARARGCDHPHAIRILAPAWTRVLWRMWTDRCTSEAARQRAASAFNTMRG